YQLKLAPTARIIKLIKTSALTFRDTLTGCASPCCSIVALSSECCVMLSASRARSPSVSVALAVYLTGGLDNPWRENQPELACRLQVNSDIDLGRRDNTGLCRVQPATLDLPG